MCVRVPHLHFSGLLFGLSDGDAKEAISSTCRAVILHAGNIPVATTNTTELKLTVNVLSLMSSETRRTASGIIYTMKMNVTGQQEVPPTTGRLSE